MVKGLLFVVLENLKYFNEINHHDHPMDRKFFSFRSKCNQRPKPVKASSIAKIVTAIKLQDLAPMIKFASILRSL